MWTWSLNWGEVTPRIVVGTCPMTMDDLGSIKAGTSVSAVLSLQHDDCLAYWGVDYGAMCAEGERLGLAMARCPIRDFDIADMRRQLPAAVTLLARLQAGEHRTYVHCTAGLGRAPLTVLGYLTLVEGRNPDDVYRLIASRRAGAVPSWEAYEGCRQDLVDRHRISIERRAYGYFRSGQNGSADADWSRAEADVLREVLCGGALHV